MMIVSTQWRPRLKQNMRMFVLESWRQKRQKGRKLIYLWLNQFGKKKHNQKDKNREEKEWTKEHGDRNIDNTNLSKPTPELIKPTLHCCLHRLMRATKMSKAQSKRGKLGLNPLIRGRNRQDNSCSCPQKLVQIVTIPGKGSEVYGCF